MSKRKNGKRVVSVCYVDFHRPEYWIELFSEAIRENRFNIISKLLSRNSIDKKARWNNAAD